MANGPKAGIIRVTFDAGGQGSFVDSNPQELQLSPGPDKQVSFSMEWHLDTKRNTFPGFEVEFGNIVPCDMEDLMGYDFQSKPVTDAKSGKRTGWSWTLTRGTDPDPANSSDDEIEYEIFFVYRRKIGSGRTRTVRLSQYFQVDPSLIVPSVGGGPGPQQPR
ncbi:MAG: hypothetical protein K0U98_00605 [Deltaproteobacteria bacterium]|nr:hypothetical protein [Deltaproteobacteria bacterium]